MEGSASTVAVSIAAGFTVNEDSSSAGLSAVDSTVVDLVAADGAK
jgi:hypothetical protein